MEKVADRLAAEQVVYHLGWKYALDLELSEEGFHARVLVYFRDRLEEKEAKGFKLGHHQSLFSVDFGWGFFY
jgi:hypothetical protein